MRTNVVTYCAGPSRLHPRGRRPASAALMAALLTTALSGCAQAPLRVEGSGVATAKPPASPTAPSLPRKALANIRNLDLRSTILADPRVPKELRTAIDTCSSCGLDNPVYTDLTGDQIDDVIVPIYDQSMQFGSIAYSVQGGQPRMVFAHVGHEATTDVDNGDIVLTRWMYARGDAQCCPSGAPEVTRYHWKGKAFVMVSRKGGGKGYAPFDATDQVVL